MSKAKFTPGPWTHREYKNHRPYGVVFHFFGRRIASDGYSRLYKLTEGGGRDCPIETLANANLIAAAPELYEALEGLMSCISETTGPNSYGALHDAMKALAKARGE